MSLGQQEQALLALVEEYRAAECSRLQAEAETEAAALLHSARREARQRVHHAVERARERAALRIRGGEAELDTRRREHRQRLGWALLSIARGQLEEALMSRWSRADSRRSWIEAAAARALASLPAGPLMVVHPPDWPESERSTLVSRARDREVSFRVDPGLRAGLFISSGGTSLDATVAGLLADTQAVDADLLAGLGEEAVQ